MLRGSHVYNSHFKDHRDVIGFEVLGEPEPYSAQWDTEPRSPLRWRSGEWELVSGRGFGAIKGELCAVEPYGSEGYQPKVGFDPKSSEFKSCAICPLGGEDGDGPSCASGSGSSFCSGYFGVMEDHQGQQYVRCTWRANTVSKEVVYHAPIVKFFKDSGPGGNGIFAMQTTALTPEEFLNGCAEELPHVLEDLEGDEVFTFEGLLPQICEIWAKLKGYKADVHEQRVLIAGAPFPEKHMRLLNGLPKESVNGKGA